MLDETPNWVDGVFAFRVYVNFSILSHENSQGYDGYYPWYFQVKFRNEECQVTTYKSISKSLNIVFYDFFDLIDYD